MSRLADPPGSEPTRLLREGDVIDVGDRSFEVIHVSGHTAGSIALWDAAAGLLFTGDAAALDDRLHAEDEVFMASLIRLTSCRWSSSAPAIPGRSVETSSEP